MLSFMARRTSSWPSFVLLLTVLTVFFTAIFFFLHYLGNRIPYDLALQRFESLETEFTRKEYVRKYADPFENCQVFNSVLRGAESASGSEGHSLHYAVLLQVYYVQGCGPIYAAINGDDPKPAALEKPRMLKTRYWWGNKAIYAIGLRFLSLAQFRQMVEFATYLAYGVLLAALVRLAPRAALAVAPVAVFGVFSSGVEYFSDVSNGVPYLWAVLATAILSLLIKWRQGSLIMPPIVTRIDPIIAMFCYIAGTISSYLFFQEGHHIYTITLFALVAWFSSQDRNVRDRAKRVGSFVAFYVVGFVACFILGQIAKIIVLELPVGPTFKNVYTYKVNVLQNLWAGVHDVAVTNSGFAPRPLIDGWSLFWTIGMGRVATGEALSLLSLAALVIAVSVAVFRCCRGHRDLLWDILLVLSLMAFVCLSLLLPNDILGRSSRFLFIIYGLMWSCLILTLMKLNWHLNVVIGGFIIGPSLVWLWVQSDRVNDLRSVYDRLTDDNIIIRDHFTVYLDEDYRSLVYVKDECRAEDTVTEFWIRIGNENLSGVINERPLKESRMNFYFEDYGVRFEGKCVAKIPLLEPEVDFINTGHIYTGNYILGSTYSGRIASYSTDYDSIAGNEPLFRDVFDVYFSQDYKSLIYVKEPCNVSEATLIRNLESQTSPLRFFLHVYPVNSEDLAESRRRYGFENRDFAFSTDGVLAGGRCITKVALPEYEIATIRTGQIISYGDQHINYWERTSSPFGRLVSYSAEYDSIAGDEPLFRDVFDVYLNPTRDSLIYVKNNCQVDDVEPRFFLHVYPVNSEDLAESRRRYGFENRDFAFSTDGVLAGGRCITKVALPEYEVATIRTGQIISYGDQYAQLWSHESVFEETRLVPFR